MYVPSISVATGAGVGSVYGYGSTVTGRSASDDASRTSLLGGGRSRGR